MSNSDLHILLLIKIIDIMLIEQFNQGIVDYIMVLTTFGLFSSLPSSERHYVIASLILTNDALNKWYGITQFLSPKRIE